MRERAALQRSLVNAVADIADRERAMHLLLAWIPMDQLRAVNLNFLKAVEDRDGS